MPQRNTAYGLVDLDFRDLVPVYRVGYRPDPFAWTPWEYADGGRFDGRWDDPEGNFRTLSDQGSDR